MFWVLSWVICGLVAGLVAKAIYPADDGLKGFLPTVCIGVVGSLIGGAINWMLNGGGSYHHAGFVMSVIGGVIFVWAYRTYRLDRYIKVQQVKIQQLEAAKPAPETKPEE